MSQVPFFLSSFVLFLPTKTSTLLQYISEEAPLHSSQYIPSIRLFGPNNHSCIFKPAFRTVLLPHSQSKTKWGCHHTVREAGECRGNDAFSLAQLKIQFNSLYFLLLLPCCETLTLIIFLALYHPFTDENDSDFVTVEGSESHLVVVVCNYK